MVVIAKPGDFALGVGAMAIVMILCDYWRIGDFASMTLWFTAGVLSWSWAFAVAGRLRPRGDVSDNVRGRFVPFSECSSVFSVYLL